MFTPDRPPAPNLSADPQDHQPDHREPPSKPDYAFVQIARIRAQLGRPKPLPADLYRDEPAGNPDELEPAGR